MICQEPEWWKGWKKKTASNILPATQLPCTLQQVVYKVEVHSGLWGESEEGGTQGDPESGPYFCVGMHKYVKKADQKLAEHDGMARFGWDDGYLVGEAAEVFQALDQFAHDVLVNCGLRLQLAKTEVYCSGQDLPPETPPGLVRAGCLVTGSFHPGMICYGVPIGSDEYVKHMLDVKVSELETQAHTMCELLGQEKQALWSVLRSSLSSKLDYWLTLCYPSDIMEAAKRMDQVIQSVLEKLIDSDIPMTVNAAASDWTTALPV